MKLSNVMSGAALTVILSMSISNGMAQSTSQTDLHCAPKKQFYQTESVDRLPLAHPHVHEKDIFWEKRVWREIDVRQKFNQRFNDENNPLIKIILAAYQKNKIKLYSTEKEDFSLLLDRKTLNDELFGQDTTMIIDPETMEEEMVVVQNEFDPSSIVRYRIKEVWYFDEERSSLSVRILGIAPIIRRTDERGNTLNEGPLFWVYYPECRNYLHSEMAHNPHNDYAHLSWTDVFDARMFHSYIVKTNNVHNNRIQDYIADPTGRLVEAQKIHEEIRNFEQDLWSN